MKVRTKYQKKCRLKKGDDVIVIAGKCLGETGKVEDINFKKGRIFVTGLNISKRHTRPSMSNQEGGIIDKVMPFDISNVALYDPKKKTPTRVGYKVEGDKKVRYSKASGTILS